MQTYFGFTSLTYDFTPDAVWKARRTIAPDSTLYALEYDNGISWKEFRGGAFPQRV